MYSTCRYMCQNHTIGIFIDSWTARATTSDKLFIQVSLIDLRHLRVVYVFQSGKCGPQCYSPAKIQCMWK